MSSPHQHHPQTNKPSPSLHSHKYDNYKLDSNNNNNYNFSHDHHHHYQLQQYDDDEQQENYEQQQQQLTKAQSFYQCTENQQKIWTLFNSLDCSQCGLMYNNKQRRPQIVCANNHLLCKSCYCTFFIIKAKIRQSSLLCPFCHVRISHKSSTSSHQSIQLFLKIYNQIYQQQKTILQEKRKRIPSCLDFQLPKNLKTLLFLLLIIVTPWIYDGLKYVVCWLIDVECRVVSFLYSQVQQLLQVVGTIVEDQFYIGLYTNEKGEYAYYGQNVWKCGLGQGQQNFVLNNEQTTNANCQQYPKTYSVLFTQKHRIKLVAYSKIMYVLTFVYVKISIILNTIYSTLRIIMYTLHFLILLVGLIQFPFLIPLMLIKLQIFVPKKYIYRIGLYLDIIEPDYEDIDAYLQMQQDVQRLTKFQLYFCLCVRNYMQYVLTMYRSVQQDMKKRCQQLQYKRKMRQAKKAQKQSQKLAKSNLNSNNATLTGGTKTKMRFSFN